MSADVVNLRQFRKRKARQDKEKTAEANRIAFGRTKAEKNLTGAVNRKERRELDQKRLESKSRSSDAELQDPSGS